VLARLDREQRQDAKCHRERARLNHHLKHVRTPAYFAVGTIAALCCSGVNRRIGGQRYDEASLASE
jgi:hypothetical protein